MPRLSEAADGHVQGATVPFPNGQDLHVQFVPERITGAMEARVASAMAAKDQGAVFHEAIGLLEACLVGWDLEDDNGLVLPTDRETLLQLPSKLIVAIQEAIGGVMRPPEKRGSFVSGS